MSSYGLIDHDILEDIGDAVREKEGTSALIPVNTLAARIGAIKTGGVNVWNNIANHCDANGNWIRPTEWPNLDNLTYGADEFYMTIDTSDRIDDPFISFRIDSTGTITCDVGHISGTSYVSDASYAVTSASAFSLDLSSYTYPVVRVKSTAHITQFFFRTYTAPNGHVYQAVENPVVERLGDCYDYGRASYSSGEPITTHYLERDKWDRHACSSRQLYMVWKGAIALQSLDVSGWDTSDWEIQNIGSAFWECESLIKLDLSHWDTSNWAVTSIGQMFQNCYSLRELNVNWDTSNWAVTNMGTVWYECYSLQKLDLSSWDTSNWAVTNMGTVWYECYSLRKLDLSSWDTSNWAVTNMGDTWYRCYSLQEIKGISSWDTSNWAVTSFNPWQDCRSLQSLDLSGWDVSNFRPTSTPSFYNCNALETLNVSGWDTSGWACTSIGGWRDCWCLRELDLSDWDVSGWNITHLNFLCADCYSLRTLNMNGWDVSGWPMNASNHLQEWYYCYSLQELDFSTWDASNWGATPIGSNALANCNAMRKLDISGFDMSKFTQFPQLGKRVEDFVCGSGNYNNYVPTSGKSFSISNTNYVMTRESLLEIINMLGTVTASGYKLYLYNLKNKLSAAEIAIATEKGWTVA